MSIKISNPNLNQAVLKLTHEEIREMLDLYEGKQASIPLIEFLCGVHEAAFGEIPCAACNAARQSARAAEQESYDAAQRSASEVL